MALTDEQRDALTAEIAGRPELVALAQADPIDTVAIAAALSTGRTEIRSRLVTARTVIAEHGPAGAVALYKLRKFAEQADSLAGNPQAFAMAVCVGWAMEFIRAEGVDVGHPQAQALLTACAVAEVLSDEEAAALKSMAVQPAPVSEFDVRCALLNDDGSLRV